MKYISKTLFWPWAYKASRRFLILAWFLFRGYWQLTLKWLFSFSIRSLRMCLFSFKTYSIPEKFIAKLVNSKVNFDWKTDIALHRIVIHRLSVILREIYRILIPIPPFFFVYVECVSWYWVGRSDWKKIIKKKKEEISDSEAWYPSIIAVEPGKQQDVDNSKTFYFHYRTGSKNK